MASTFKVLLGLGAAVFIGFALGLIRFFLPQKIQKNYFFNLAIDLIKFPPPIAWIPFIILLMGVNLTAAVVIVVIGGMPPFFTIIYDALINTEAQYVKLSKTLQLSLFKSVFYIYLPSQYSKIYTGLRVSLGMCWMSIIASEMISSQSGLGYLIQMHRINLDYQLVLVDIAIIAVCGYGMDRLLKWIETKHLVWVNK
ncbi:MAG: ABC transporter permease [Pseudobdellovibrio sp.]